MINPSNNVIQDLKDEAGRLLMAKRPSPAVDVWIAKVRSALVSRFGPDHSVVTNFEDAIGVASFQAPFVGQAWQRQQLIVRDGLQLLEGVIRDEAPGVAKRRHALDPTIGHAVFVSHSGESDALARLLRFISACGLRPLLAERQAFHGGTIPDHVRRVMDECAMSVVFAEATVATTSTYLPGPGVLVEVGVVQERFGERVVYLVQKGVEVGAMLRSFAYTHFTPDCLEEAFERLVVEFRTHGLMTEASAR